MKRLILLCVLFIGNISAMPDFYIIGATKCGTTSLYDYLIKHPKILGAQRKELKFFSNDKEFAKGKAYYKRLFPTKQNASELIGEATPGYFWKPQCTKRIASFSPKAKLILMLRNPVKRAISHYFFCEDRKGIKNICPRYATFEQAIQNEGYREAIIGIGCYLDHIKRWLECYPRSQLLIIILEDLIANPEQEVNKVFNFLGLKSLKLNEYETKAKGRYNQGSIDPKTTDWLYKYYEPFNKNLEAFLGRSLPWKKEK